MASDQTLLQFVQAYAPQQQKQAEETASISKQLASLVAYRDAEIKKVQGENKKKNEDRIRKQRAEDRKDMRKSRAGISEFLSGKLRANKKEESGLMKFLKKTLGIAAVIGGGVLLYKKFEKPIKEGMGKLKKKLEKLFKQFGKWVGGPLKKLGIKLGEKVMEGLKWALDTGMQKLGGWLGTQMKKYFVEPLQEWGQGILVETGIAAFFQKGNGEANSNYGSVAMYGGENWEEAHQYIDSELNILGATPDGQAVSANLTPEQKARIAELRKRRKELDALRKDLNSKIFDAYSDPIGTTGDHRDKLRVEYGKKAVEIAHGDDTVKRQSGGLVSSPSLKSVNLEPLHRQTGGPVAAKSGVSGQGWSVGSDYKGRPAIFSKPAASAFMKMMKASEGKVRPGDITSAKRSPAHNRRVGGVPNSAHLSGNAVDYSSGTPGWHWIKKNGAKYGWTFNNYMGPSGWHFDYVGGGASSAADTKEKGSVLSGGHGSHGSNDGSGAGGSTGGLGMFSGITSGIDNLFGLNQGGNQSSGDGGFLGSLFGSAFGMLSSIGGHIGTFISEFMTGVGDIFKGLFGMGEEKKTTVPPPKLKPTKQPNTVRFSDAIKMNLDSDLSKLPGGQVIVIKRKAKGGGILPVETGGAKMNTVASGLDVNELNSNVDAVSLTDEIYRQFASATF